jgi:hypothetical protein
MDSTLSISSDHLDAEALQDFTRDLCNTINRETAIRATLAESASEAGVKGAEIGLGTIILTLIGSSGVAVSLINVLRAYFQRSRHLRITIDTKNGNRIELDGTNLEPGQIENTIKLLNKALKPSR